MKMMKQEEQYRCYVNVHSSGMLGEEGTIIDEIYDEVFGAYYIVRMDYDGLDYIWATNEVCIM